MVWDERSCDRVPLLGFYQTGVAVTSVASFITSFLNVLTSETDDDDKLCDDDKHCDYEDDEADELENEEQDGAQIGVIVRQRKKTQSAPKLQNWLDYSNNETKESMKKDLKSSNCFR